MKKSILVGASVLLAWSALAAADRVFDIDTYLAAADRRSGLFETRARLMAGRACYGNEPAEPAEVLSIRQGTG